jgi:hypothetical protein
MDSSQSPNPSCMICHARTTKIMRLRLRPLYYGLYTVIKSKTWYQFPIFYTILYVPKDRGRSQNRSQIIFPYRNRTNMMQLRCWLRLRSLYIGLYSDKIKNLISISDFLHYCMLYVPKDRGRSRNRNHNIFPYRNRTNMMQLRCWLRLRSLYIGLYSDKIKNLISISDFLHYAV